MATTIPTATFPGKNTDSQSTEPLVDLQRRITPNWRRWTEFVDITVRRLTTVTSSGAGGINGFGFSIGGLMLNKELLGIGIFSKDIIFPSTKIPYSVACLSPAAVDTSLIIVPSPHGVDGVTAATIKFLAGAYTATVTWTSPPYLLAANMPFKFYAASPADVSLSLITGFVPGDLA